MIVGVGGRPANLVISWSGELAINLGIWGSGDLSGDLAIYLAIWRSIWWSGPEGWCVTGTVTATANCHCNC